MGFGCTLISSSVQSENGGLLLASVSLSSYICKFLSSLSVHLSSASMVVPNYAAVLSPLTRPTLFSVKVRLGWAYFRYRRARSAHGSHFPHLQACARSICHWRAILEYCRALSLEIWGSSNWRIIGTPPRD